MVDYVESPFELILALGAEGDVQSWTGGDQWTLLFRQPAAADIGTKDRVADPRKVITGKTSGATTSLFTLMSTFPVTPTPSITEIYDAYTFAQLFVTPSVPPFNPYYVLTIFNNWSGIPEDFRSWSFQIQARYGFTSTPTAIVPPARPAFVTSELTTMSG